LGIIATPKILENPVIYKNADATPLHAVKGSSLPTAHYKIPIGSRADLILLYIPNLVMITSLFLYRTKLIFSYFSSFSKQDAKFSHAMPERTGVYAQTAGSPIWAIDSVVTQQESIFDMIPHHLIQSQHVLFETGE
jgi:hypothetical protein